MSYRSTVEEVMSFKERMNFKEQQMKNISMLLDHLIGDARDGWHPA